MAMSRTSSGLDAAVEESEHVEHRADTSLELIRVRDVASSMPLVPNTCVEPRRHGREDITDAGRGAYVRSALGPRWERGSHAPSPCAAPDARTPRRADAGPAVPGRDPGRLWTGDVSVRLASGPIGSFRRSSEHVMCPAGLPD